MLYYVIPPIIIIICLSLLIFFLFRKFSVEGKDSFSLLENRDNDFLGKEKQGALRTLFSNFWFRLLERLTQKMKLFSLRMHNTSNSWFHSVKNKREKMNLTEKESFLETAIIDKENVQIKVEEDLNNLKNKNSETFIAKETKIDNFSIKNRIVRGKKFVSEIRKSKITKPIEKNRLEDALIKRIAVNPKDIEAYERLGDYYSDTKNFKDAIECYKQVIKLSPRNLKVKIKLKNLERILKK